MNRSLIVVTGLMIGLTVVGACSSPQPPPTTDRPSSKGPIVDYDPEGLVGDVQWIDPSGGTPALPYPLPEGGPRAALMERISDSTALIAVNGSGCVPETRLHILSGPPVVRIEVKLLEAVPDPGLECAGILTTHAFVIRLDTQKPIDAVIVTDVDWNPEGG